MMLAALATRLAGSAVPLRFIGLAAAGATIAAAVAYHAVTVVRLERDVAQAQAAMVEARADVARRDASIGELERAIERQNLAVVQMEANGQAREKRAAMAARLELTRPPTLVPQDVAALNLWIRRTAPGDAE